MREIDKKALAIVESARLTCVAGKISGWYCSEWRRNHASWKKIDEQEAKRGRCR